MTDDRLTPEERALIAAAVEWRSTAWSTPDLVAAIEAYEASITPQPVECLMTRTPGKAGTPDGWTYAYPLDFPGEFVETWRVTITPIKRVR